MNLIKLKLETWNKGKEGKPFKKP